MDHSSQAQCLDPSPTRVGRFFAGYLGKGWAWAALLALWTIASSQAAVRFDVFLGYDGVVPEASWFPVAFEVENDGPGFQGVVEVTAGTFGQDHSRRIAVELPTGTQKRFVLPVFSGAGNRNIYSYNARLLDEQGKVRAEQTQLRPRHIAQWQVPVMASISRVPPTLPPSKAEREVDLRVARLQPGLFPDNPIALEGLATLYISSGEALGNNLQVPQIDALLSWLYAGGHLIVGVEQAGHIQATEWLRRLLPCDVTDMRLVDSHPEFQQWVASDRRVDGAPYSFIYELDREQARAAKTYSNPFAQLTEDTEFESQTMEVATGRVRDGTVVVGTSEQPLLVTAARGRGRLTLLGFSPERQPFRSWKNQPYFWAKLSGLPPEIWASSKMNFHGGYSSDGVFGAMIETDQIRKLPVGWLLALLVVYLVVIGPLDHWWLKKIGRQMLTWITFPFYVVLFSGLIYLIGYRLRAGDTEWNELHVVDVIPLPAGTQADWHGRGYASIYSPVNAHYQVSCSEPFATFRAEFQGNYRGGQESSRLTVLQRGDRFDARAFVPVWTSQLYVADWFRQDNSPVDFRIVARADGGYDVTIDNSLGQSLDPVRVVINGRVHALDRVPANKVSVQQTGGEGLPLSNFVDQHGAQFRSVVTYRQQAFGRSEPVRVADVPLSAMAASFLSELTTGQSYEQFIGARGTDLSRGGTGKHPVLLAWVHGFSPVAPLNQFPARRGQRQTLLRVSPGPSSTL